MNVVVAYVDTKGKTHLKSLNLETPCTLNYAIYLSGLLDELGMELAPVKEWLDSTPPDTTPNHKAWFVGIFSQKKPLDHPLKDGDRVEIYRPLTLDPMNSRQNKVKLARKQQNRLNNLKNKSKL